jgi:hypothetical protein
MNCTICGAEVTEPSMVINAYNEDNELIDTLACCENEDCIEKFVTDYAEPLFPPDAVDEMEITFTSGETVKVVPL